MDKDNLLVFNISFVLLTLEVLYTRIFSVVLWYHYAFLIVSLSLLGLGAGGVFYLLSQKKLEDNTLYWLTPLLPLSILSGLYTVTHTPLNPTLPFHEVYWKWLVYCLAISAPYVIGGVCMTDIYTKKHKKIESLYASDLMGAGLACMAVVVMLPILGGENSVLLASILAGITALTVYWKSTNKGLLITLFVIFILLNFYFMESTKFKIQYQHIDKTKWISKSFITKWNVFSRVDITPGVKVSWAQSKLWENQTNTSIPVYTLLIDSGAATAILLNLSDLSVLYYDLPYVGYDLINKGDKTALIIGSGGGVDVLSALYFNYSKITAVEINPAVIDSVNEVNPEIYNNPKIQVEINDGRGFIRGSPQKYDMIGLTLVDTWAALNSGAYSLSENFLYTREAFGEYLDHLTPQGIVSISWWKQRRSRFLSVVAEAYKRRNIEHPEDYVIVINNGRLDTFLLKREPFTDDEIKTIKAKADKLGFNAYSQDKMTELFGKVDPYLITDDNPFFFNDWIGHRVILSIIIISVILLSILIILPLIAKGNLRDIKTLDSLAYFLAIGAGYMLIEIPLIQRFSLLLGAPTLSFTVIIFTLLASTGVGSLHARKLTEKINLVFVFLILLIILDTTLLPPAIKKLSVLPLAGRILATVIVLFPLGVLLGVFFPTGIRAVSEREAETIPWMWGMNSIASVIGATTAPYIAIQHGFTAVLASSIPMYTLAYIILKFRTSHQFK